MGLLDCSINAPRHGLLLLLLLLFNSCTHVRHSVEGRPLTSKIHEVTKEGKEAKVAMLGSMIGSRPPRCEGRCLSCGRCEAVQVPVIPQGKNIGIGRSPSAITSRGDDSSNYKPLSWKCKCGGRILNP